MAGTKTQPGLSHVNPLEKEAVRSFAKNVAKGTLDEFEESGKTFLAQILGLDNKNSHHSQKATQTEQDTHAQPHKNVEIFNLKNHQNAETPKAHTEKAHSRAEAAIDYHRDIVKSRERASKGETHEMQRNIEQIKVELSKLVASSHVLKLQFAEVSVEQSSTTVGEYHINFFEWMLTVIRSAREKVEDSGAWLGTVKGKGAKRDYWGMFKQHGTTFGLSGERAVATQVG